VQREYEVLLVSQFTLFGVMKGNKPDFHVAMPPSQVMSHAFAPTPYPGRIVVPLPHPFPYKQHCTRGPHKVLPMCSHLLGRLPFDENPGVSPLGCALLALRACLLVLLCRAHPSKFVTRYLPYPVYPTVLPNVLHPNSTLPCFKVVWNNVAGMI
jgi:hypothetical protein